MLHWKINWKTFTNKIWVPLYTRFMRKDVCYRTILSIKYDKIIIWSRIWSKKKPPSEVLLYSRDWKRAVSWFPLNAQQQFCKRTNNITVQLADQTVGNMPTYIGQIIKIIPDGPNETPNCQKQFHRFDWVFIWKKLADQTNWQYIKLILNLQAFLILFQGV